MKLSKFSLIVSCQAPVDSPLHDPKIIAAMAKAAINQGAKAIRVDTPSHVEEVQKQLPYIPIIGLWKRLYSGYDVYITPCCNDALAIAQAGADIIAIDATLRERPQGETVPQLINYIHQELGKLVMADVDTLESAISASEAGADLVGTTLYGYTKETENLSPPGYLLLQEMVKQLKVPVIAEGGISTPEEAKKALDYGAYAVVVGTAITGIDLKVKAFQSVFLC
ncbi:N-acetylmannosamine-6-phosphate 2-epimerase [Aphanothece sacrum]|uniref:Putative N-acetylmannosamine-6-phosphate 2-epimerase n=1 Tax=Aphanothece sacrum FPU1 TaxID=1920663 RepID=A0A401IH06_APHSA|nr:N-acetylmannosamine-6-phosphate 2-epimerase [Aphanothece sacrum]GBF80563.1 N-acetylmannosamine-6-phosphate 2-epimerase [Aphanothece sacrum FPU1]GBF84047.1 N-acetylmannosamine-6-phosphate 2-epimerase [Aphanothece sacrum FPU3]